MLFNGMIAISDSCYKFESVFRKPKKDIHFPRSKDTAQLPGNEEDLIVTPGSLNWTARSNRAPPFRFNSMRVF